MEFKQNKFLPAEKQIVTANPDINTVCTLYFVQYLLLLRIDITSYAYLFLLLKFSLIKKENKQINLKD